MVNINETAFPPYYVNKYLNAQLINFGIFSENAQMTPIFPSIPNNIEEVFKNYIASPEVGDPLVIQYERLVRFRTGPFYPRKREQLVYYLYCTNNSKIVDAIRIITDCMDREDASAQDLNKWINDNPENFTSGRNIFFHNTRVYQADESRDILELASARTVLGNKLIIEYDYHSSQSYYN